MSDQEKANVISRIFEFLPKQKNGKLVPSFVNEYGNLLYYKYDIEELLWIEPRLREASKNYLLEQEEKIKKNKERKENAKSSKSKS